MLLPFVLLVGVLIIVSMLVMSFFYNWLDARASSWDRLTPFYETEKEPDSNCIVHGTFAMNDRCYRGIAVIGASGRGSYLALERSHQFLHPALLIPWSDIEALPVRTDGRFVLRITATAAKLRVEGAAVGEIRRFLPGDGPRLKPLAA